MANGGKGWVSINSTLEQNFAHWKFWDARAFYVHNEYSSYDLLA